MRGCKSGDGMVIIVEDDGSVLAVVHGACRLRAGDEARWLRAGELSRRPDTNILLACFAETSFSSAGIWSHAEPRKEL